MYMLDSGRLVLKLLHDQGILQLEDSATRPAILSFTKVEKFKSGNYKLHLKDGRDVLFEDGNIMLKSIMESADAMKFVLFA